MKDPLAFPSLEELRLRQQPREDNPEPTQIVMPDTEASDTVEQRMLDILEHPELYPGGVAPFIEELIAAERIARDSEVIAKTIAYILSSKNPGLTAWSLACAAEMCLGIDQPAIARKLGVSKQDVNKAVDSARGFFGLRQTRGMRDGESRRKFSLRNRRGEK